MPFDFFPIGNRLERVTDETRRASQIICATIVPRVGQLRRAMGLPCYVCVNPSIDELNAGHNWIYATKYRETGEYTSTVLNCESVTFCVILFHWFFVFSDQLFRIWITRAKFGYRLKGKGRRTVDVAPVVCVISAHVTVTANESGLIAWFDFRLTWDAALLSRCSPIIHVHARVRSFPLSWCLRRWRVGVAWITLWWGNTELALAIVAKFFRNARYSLLRRLGFFSARCSGNNGR